MATAKRDLLLETAERLFYAEGFHATGIDRIVQAAGVVRMTLYNHFPSKNALVAAVLERRHTRFLAAVDAATQKAPDGRATWALVDAHGKWLRTSGQHGCFLMKAAGEFAEHAPEIRDQALAAKQDLRRRLADTLARDGYATGDGLAERLQLVLEGANASVPLYGAQATLRHTRATVARLLDCAADPELTASDT
ncbi:MAG: helix-turn-helix domain-containing protein [Rhodovibrio sp.]|nr:helix-turn-helix domain-containing protein [Rhodovibrio sp.]